MKYTYFIGYAISFNPKVYKNGHLKHNWFYSNWTFAINKRIDSGVKLRILIDKLYEKHNCNFVIIQNINLLKKEWFKKVKRLEDLDFKKVEILGGRKNV